MYYSDEICQCGLLPREKKKEIKASKLKYYNENADKINRKISRPLEPSVISNAAIRQQKSRKNKAVQREKNRLYQVTLRKKVALI